MGASIDRYTYRITGLMRTRNTLAYAPNSAYSVIWPIRWKRL